MALRWIKLNNLNLHDVLYVPKITKNLLSISKLTVDNNILIEFDENCCFVKDKLIGKTLLKRNLKMAYVNYVTIKTLMSTCLLKKNWNRKLGHPNNKVLEKVLKECNVNTSPSDSFTFCEAFQFEKFHILPFKTSYSYVKEILDLIHSNVWCNIPTWYY